MPSTIWAYITALLYFTRVSTCTAIAEALGNIAHDRLTRMLNGTFSGHTLLDFCLRFLFLVSGGCIYIDDTVLEKPYSRLLREASWTYSSSKGKAVFGVPVVLLVWSNGIYRIPLAFRIKKKGGPSKISLALELLSYARNQLKIKPEFVMFDSWYSARKILKRVSDYGWYYISQLKKNRKFQDVQLKNYLWQPYWNAKGKLSGNIKVLVVKHRRKYFVTNRLSLDAKEVRKIYKKRQDIEEVIKCLKSELNLESCQAGYQRRLSKPKPMPSEGAQEHHIALCLVSYLILERERFERGLTWRKFRRQLIYRGRQLHLPVLDRVMNAA